MTTHTNCTHEKTKAARAACRKAGGATTTTTNDDARAKLRHKAAKASEKLSKAHAEGDTPANAASAVSGFCGNGTHDRCPAGGRQWSCSCECHTK